MTNIVRHINLNTTSIRSVGFSLILSVLFLLPSKEIKATHAMGMDLIYEQISADSFLVTLAFYRDCEGVAAPASATLNVRSANCNYNFNVTLARLGNGQEITPVCTNLTTRCAGGTYPGSEEYLYQAYVVLPAQCTDWKFSNSICCRNNAITTINNPGNQRIYVEAEVNNFYVNSSPVFSNNPVPFVCSHQTYCFNNGAIDSDGDSLVYSLITPRKGVNAGDTITFNAGYSNTNPITSSPQISLDPVTGDLCMFPTDSTEIGVLAVLVQEYRNGVLISSIMRDIQLRILGCPSGNNLPTASGIDSTSQFSTKVCANSNTTFNIYSDDIDTNQNVTMTWNQAIAGASFTTTAGPRPVATFSWTPSTTDIRAQPYCFTVTVADEACPFNGQQVFSYCVYVVGIESIVDSLFDPTCPGDCDGRAMVTIHNGIPPFTYLWNDSSMQTTARATGLCGQAYSVTGSDSTGCTTTTSVTLSDPKPMDVYLSSIGVSCNGGSDGQAIVDSVNSGTAPFSFQWENDAGNQTTDTANGLIQGVYSVTVTDSNNCVAEDSVLVTEPLDLTTTMVAVTNVSCKGFNDGELTVTINGGTQPYSLQWDSLSGFQTGDTAYNLLAGLHTVVITDANGCVKQDTLTITEPGSDIILSLVKTDINCFGDSTGQATVTATGGTPPYNYNWDAGTGNQTTPTASNLPAGTYSVIVTDSNNCTAIPNIDINQPLSALTVVPVDSFVECNGDNNGVASVNVTGGSTPYTFQWDASASSQTTQFASGLSAGIYSVEVNDSLGCADTVNVTVLQATAPLIVNIGKNDVTCNNGFDGKAFVTITGGEPNYTITWDTNANSQTTDTAFNLFAGTYTVNVTDSFGCKIDTGISISQPPPLITLATFSTNVSCFGDSNGTASVTPSGGTPPYTYEWSANTGLQTNDTAFGLPAGTYYVTVFDSNQCVTSPGIIVDEPTNNLFATAGSFDANCFNANDGFAFVSGTGGTQPYSYAWDSLANNQTTDTAFNLSAGLYQVTVTDSNACTYDTLIPVSQPLAPLSVNLTASPVLCFSGGDGEAYATVSGGTQPYSILWDTTAGSQTGDTALNLPSAYHRVFVTDTNQCDIVDSVFVGGPAEPVSISSGFVGVSCFGLSDGMAIANASGGTAPYSYQWDAAASNQVTDTAINLAAGSYSVTVTDSNSCDSTISVSVTEPDLLQDSIFVSSDYKGSAIECFGDSNGAITVNPFGGTAPYQIQWDTASGNQTGNTATGLGEGVYSVLITDTNGCTTSDQLGIASPPRMGFSSLLIQNISCFGGSNGRIEAIAKGGTPGYTYVWSKPVATGNLVDGLPADSGYALQIRDTNECTFDTTITLTQPDSLELDSIGEFDPLCNNQLTGSAVAYVRGGTSPYSYRWQISQGIFQLTDTAIGLGAGFYPLLISDSLGCEILDTAFIDEPDKVLVSVSSNDTICAFQPVEITAQGSNGIQPYSYVWNPDLGNSNAMQIVAPDQTSNYVVRAQDSNGCLSDPALVTIFVRGFEDDTLFVFGSGSICEGDTAEVTAFHNGPFGGYSYRWNFGPNTFGPHFVDSAGYYVFTVSDICQNELADSVLIEEFENPVIGIEAGGIMEEGCSPLAVIFRDSSNEDKGLEYRWDFGDGNIVIGETPSYTFNNAGTYDIVLTLTNGNECSTTNAENPSKVVVYPTPVASFESDPLVTDMRSPVFTFDNLSTQANSYNWNFGDGDTSTLFEPTKTYGDTGTYTVSLLAVNNDGCLDQTELRLIVLPYYILDVPNAFTPSSSNQGGNWRNDPESNRVFFPYTDHPEAITQYEMLIFNRWGELIFTSESIYEGWDGYYRDRLSTQEVYVYKISLRWDNGQEFEKVGDVTLFR